MHTTFALLLAASVVGQPPDWPPFAREYTKTLTFYYKSPDATQGPRRRRPAAICPRR